MPTRWRRRRWRNCCGGRSNSSPIAWRVSSTDIHARDHRVKARIGVKRDGTITAFEIDDLTGVGPYSVYPRTSGIEANQVVNLVGGPYTCPNYRARARVVFQNKNVMCQYRAVGHPIATAVTEGLVELAAAKIGMDPVELRRRNLFADDGYPATGASGIKFEKLSHHAALDKILAMMDYAKLRAEQAALRARGIYRGIGLASFIEVTNPSAAFYGVGGARISSQDGATVRLNSTGAVFVHSGVTEQGQGTESVLAQCVATSFGVPIERVRVVTGDTDNTPYGGGTWASRAAGIGGEAAWQAGKALRGNVLAAAASILQADPKALDIRAGIVVDADTGRERLPLEEVARIVYFRPDTLPPGFQAEFAVTRHYVPRGWPFAFTNGVQASSLEVDAETGVVKLLRHWCVEDCGTLINPQLVDEQIRGGIVQGIGGALYEHCVYDESGQLLNGYDDGLSGADGGRNARHRRRPRGDADGGLRAWRQGRRRSRHRRRAGLRHERHQRCAPPARRRTARGNADHAGASAAGAAEGVICARPRPSGERCLWSPSS